MSRAPERFETERLIARRPSAADEEFFVTAWSDPRVAGWLGGSRDRDGVRALLKHFDDLWNHDADGTWILEDRTTKQPVGWILLHPMDFGGHTGTMTTNVASRGVMEKLGMQYDRNVEHAGLPHVLYRLDRQTWEKTHG